MNTNRTATILLVDDNDNDVFIARKAYDRANLPVSLHHVENGEECLKFLRKESPYDDAPNPDLILLDLDMPVMNGQQVMEAIFNDADLRHLPVIFLTNTSTPETVQEMYKLRCNSYYTKPADFHEYKKVLDSIYDHWLSIVVLPEQLGEDGD